MSTIYKRVLESFRKKLSNDQLTQLFNLLNRIGFNRTFKFKGGSVGSLMDGTLNQPLKFNNIDTIQSLRSIYSNGGLAQLEILDLLSKINFKDLNLSDLKLIKEFNLEDK